jgi:hypothetical protein
MNKTKILTLIFCLLQISIFGQKKTVTTTVQYGVENQELFELFQFQNLAVEKFTFQGNEIKNKSYKIFIKEFKDGKLTDTKVLFDGTETDYFKIEYSQLKFKIFSELSRGNLKIQLRSETYGSGIKNFKLYGKSEDYIMRDFFNEKIAIEYPIDEEFAILAIITPTLHKDGSASYCEVVQADIKPEKLGEHFKIPHYFLVTMKFQ